MNRMPGRSRREFLWTATAAVPLLPFIRVDEAAAFAVAEASWRTDLVGGQEPGSRLVISGRVLQPDGAPAAGIRLSVYHTDSEGYYTRPVSDSRRARIRGAVVTDKGGRYAFHTIKPGPYPASQQASHVHVHVEGPGYPEHWIDSFLFEGDPYLREPDLAASRAAGRFAHIMAEQRDPAGVLQCHREIRLDTALAERNRLVNGWYRD